MNKYIIYYLNGDYWDNILESINTLDEDYFYDYVYAYCGA